jgi:hypothetical protein
MNSYHSNPIKSDSDSDGLTDYEEVVTYSTDPMDSDSDNGTVDDGTEVLTNSTDPNDASDDVPAEEATTSFSCSSVTLSSNDSELDADVSSQDITLSVTIEFDTQIAVWQRSLFAMVSLASTETWTGGLRVRSSVQTTAAGTENLKKKAPETPETHSP